MLFFSFASVNFLLATWLMFSYCPCGLVVLLFWSPCEGWNFWIFLSEIFKLFPVKTHFFRNPFIFCTFCLQSRGFEIAPARGSPANVLGHVMTSRDYIKSWTGPDLTSYFWSYKIPTVFFWMLFSILLQLFSSWLHGSRSVFAFGVSWFYSFVLHTMIGVFGFIGLKFSN